VLVRDPAAGGSFEEWQGWLDAAGIHFTMSPPPARRLELRFLLPGAHDETRAGHVNGELVHGQPRRAHHRELGLLRHSGEREEQVAALQLGSNAFTDLILGNSCRSAR
jgi:hypothetical protein